VDQDKLRTLRLLEAIETREAATQRDLARDLNISLGLVNAFMKRLAGKGYFRIITIPKNKVKYLLTPQGVREKSRLTHEYLDYSMGFYRQIKEVLERLFARLEREGARRIALYGCGEVAELAYLFLHKYDISLAGVFDEKGDGKTFFGNSVFGREALNGTAFDYVLLTQTSDLEQHYERLMQAGIEPKRIVHLWDGLKAGN
jgi:DNA-binding MarR family transcriptional regulator